MYIVTNTTKIKKDEGYKLINRFDKVGKIEKMEGFLGLEVFSTKKLKDFDQVTVVTRWESEDYFSAWMKSDAFKWAHQYDGGKPEYILSNKVSHYELEVTRNPIVPA
ncbi:MAG TPA: heme oxygenase [Virgibacillus sp.]|nr:heme oxygenase [Virgibacillus sp.]